MKRPLDKNDRKILRIFLIYTIADRDLAQKLYNLLSQRDNLSVFTPEMLSAGENWESKLLEEITQSDIFIALLTSNSFKSGWVLKELGAAWALDKQIIPVVLNPEILSRIPLPLQKIRYIEMKDLDNPEILDQILENHEEVGALS